MFPSLVNCCTIDWFTEWPEDALEKVATKFLEDMDMDDEVINTVFKENFLSKNSFKRNCCLFTFLKYFSLNSAICLLIISCLFTFGQQIVYI